MGVVVIRSPFQTKFQFCRVPRMGGIKLQLLCGVRIELAVGSLPYLARYPSRSLPIPLGGTKYPLRKKGCYKHANPLGLRKNPNSGTSHHWTRSGAQTNKQNINKKEFIFY